MYDPVIHGYIPDFPRATHGKGMHCHGTPFASADHHAGPHAAPRRSAVDFAIAATFSTAALTSTIATTALTSTIATTALTSALAATIAAATISATIFELGLR